MGNIFSSILSEDLPNLISLVRTDITLRDLIKLNNMEESKVDSLIELIQTRVDCISKDIVVMRKIHNEIKEKILRTGMYWFKKQTGNDAKRLLDIAVGKGGDLNKWVKLKLEYVYGFDINPLSIEEAKRRFNTLKHNPNNMEAVFRSCQNLGWTKDSFRHNLMESSTKAVDMYSFDIVSCQFALHYFVDTDEKINKLFSFIDVYLKPGGCFVGTTLSNKKLALLMGDKKSFRNNYFSIDNYNKKSYSIHINGTDYYETKGAKTKEYIVDLDKLNTIAKRYNMSLVPDATKFFETYQDIYNKEELLKRFGVSELDRELLRCSYLNTTFVFIKK